MTTYIYKRLLLIPLTLLGVTLLVFTLVRVTPGDVADAFVTLESAGGYTREDQAKIAQRIRKEVGLDRPFPVQYAQWLGEILRGTFGHSYWQKRPVIEIIKERAPVTVEISFFAIIAAILWSVPAGFVAALKQNSLVDQILRVFAVGGLSLPEFFVGIMMIFFLATIFQWIPPLIWSPLWESPTANLIQVAFPVLVLAYGVGAPIARLTRSEVLDSLREDYVRTARAKGLSERVILYRHVLRNAILPVMTMAGWSFARMLGGVVVIETVFNLPGLGLLLVTSVALRDYDVVGAMVVLLGTVFLTINLVVDILYGVVDPRIRLA